MSVGERDPHTGHMTTGHEWNGIKELNTPVPRPVYFFLITTAAYALVYWLLMPAWPVGVTYTKGLLGIDQRTTVAEKLEQAAADRAAWIEKIEAADFEAIQSDDALMRIVRGTGRALFGDNCSVCHGADAQGGTGYPALTDASWLWGGDPETVAETLRVGINSSHEETRMSQMLAFGRDQVLNRAAILDVAAYVQSLSDPAIGAGPQAEAVKAGEEIFAFNCAACHGEDGKGSPETGAPNLTDGFWIYGGDRQSIYTTVFEGRQGYMPHWENRLTPVDRKILTLYILDLGSVKP
jgi:cytochrome c oxidase cbb3-type subunit III